MPLNCIHFLYADGRDWGDPDNLAWRYLPGRLGVDTTNGYDQLADDTACVRTVRQYIDSMIHGGIIRRSNGLSETVPGMSADDTIFIYLTGHGGIDGYRRAYLSVRPIVEFETLGMSVLRGDSLLDSCFASMLDSMACAHRLILMQQCHSGGFLQELGDGQTSIACAA